MAWIKKTFDKIYLEAFNFLNKRSRKEVNEIIKLLKIKKSHLILDLCCGWGRHVCSFYKKSYNIRGIDISNEFISYAKKTCKPKLFSIKDVKKLNYKNEFDIILNLETSFGYYGDNTNKIILRKIYAALRKDGKFLLDLINPSYVANNFKKRLIIYEKEKLKIIDLNELNKQKDVIKTKRLIYLKGKSYTKEIILRLYNKQELKIILKNIGFEKIRFFGKLNGDKYNSKSPRLIVLAEK